MKVFVSSLWLGHPVVYFYFLSHFISADWRCLSGGLRLLPSGELSEHRREPGHGHRGALPSAGRGGHSQDHQAARAGNTQLTRLYFIWIYSRSHINSDFLFNHFFRGLLSQWDLFCWYEWKGLRLRCWKMVLEVDFGQKLTELWPWKEEKLRVRKCSKLFCFCWTPVCILAFFC